MLKSNLPRSEPRWAATGRTVLIGTAAGLAAGIVGGATTVATALVIVVGILVVIVVAAKLRRLPPRSSVPRFFARGFLAVAVLAVIASFLVPSSWTGWTVLLAAAFGLAGCLTPASAQNTFRHVIGAAAIGSGVALFEGGVEFLPYDTAVGLAVAGVGVVEAGAGIGILLASDRLIGLALIGFSTALLGAGSELLREYVMLGAALLGVGAVMVATGVGLILPVRVRGCRQHPSVSSQRSVRVAEERRNRDHRGTS